MIRVLLVLDRDGDFQARRGVEQLCAGLGKEFDVTTKTIGPGGEWLNVVSAAWRMRKLAREFDVVHAWGTGALSSAAFSPFRRILFTPARFPTRAQIGWARAIASYRELDVICPTAAMRRAIVARGIAVERCHLIRPGVDFARVRRRRSRELRERLGFEEHHQVILACGESTRGANHWLATWAAAILNVLDHRTRLLVWGRGPGVGAIARFAASLHQPELVTVAQEKLGRAVEFEELLAAADMALVSASGPVATLPIAICMAGALPIVATVTPTVAELLEDRHTAVMVSPDVPRFISQKVTQLRADENLARSISDRARAEAYDYFPLTRFLEQHRIAYRTVAAGARIELADPACGRTTMSS